jgi:hypothetical protein
MMHLVLSILNFLNENLEIDFTDLEKLHNVKQIFTLE